MRDLNLILKFVLELVALAGFAAWGATLHPGPVAITVATLGPLVAAGMWSVFAAPRSSRRLRRRARVSFELGVFGLAAVAYGTAGAPALAIAFVIVAVINTAALEAVGSAR